MIIGLHYNDIDNNKFRIRLGLRMNYKMKNLVFGTWTVLTLLDISKNRPERRPALLSNELFKYNTDIAALSESRLSDNFYFIQILKKEI